jgi:RNA recognition motif
MSSTVPISPPHRKGKRKIETAPPSDVVVNSDAPLAEPKENKKKRKRVQSNAISSGTGEETEAREVAGDGSLHVPSSHPDSEAEIEVLSHAALRKRKKAKIASDPSPSILSNKNTENTPQSSSAPQRQNSVWVGNLTFKTTTQQLREFFQFAGDITRIHMPTKAVAKGNDKDKRLQNRGYLSSQTFDD